MDMQAAGDSERAGDEGKIFPFVRVPPVGAWAGENGELCEALKVQPRFSNFPDTRKAGRGDGVPIRSPMRWQAGGRWVPVLGRHVVARARVQLGSRFATPCNRIPETGMWSAG